MEFINFSIDQIINCLNSDKHYFIIEDSTRNNSQFYVFNDEENILLLKEYKGSCIDTPCKYTYKFKLSYLNRKPNLELVELFDSELRSLKFESCSTSNSRLIVKFWKYGVYNVNISKQDILYQMLIYDDSHKEDITALDTSNKVNVRLEKGPNLIYYKVYIEYPNHKKYADFYCHIVLYLDIDIRPNRTYEIICQKVHAEYSDKFGVVVESKVVEFKNSGAVSDDLCIDLNLEDI